MIEKLVIEGVPSQAINFVKAYCNLTGQNLEEYWRKEVASTVNSLLDLLAEHQPGEIRRRWFLDDAFTELKTPRDAEIKKMDEAAWKDHLRERKKQKQ